MWNVLWSDVRCGTKSLLRHVKNVELSFHHIKLVPLYFLCALVTYPILVPLLIIAVIYRRLVKYVVQSLDPKCGDMLSGVDAWLAAPCPYKTPAVVLSPYFTVTSKLDRDEIIKILNEKVIKPDYYPELRQRIVRRGGYFFRYPVQNFKVDDHVSYLNPESPERPVMRSELRRLGTDVLGTMSFDPSKSPWELVLVPNLVDENDPSIKSALFLRVNHCLMDGYSMVYFLQKVAFKPWKLQLGHNSTPSQKPTKTAKKMKLFLQIVELVVTGPYHAIIGTFMSLDLNAFLKKALTPRPGTSPAVFKVKETEPARIDGKILKKVRDAHGVGISSLLITLAAEAAIRFIKRESINGIKDVPKRISLLMSVPLPGHPDRMTNYWSWVRIVIPVSAEDDPRETLQSVHQQFERIKTSIVPLVGYVTLKIFGLLPIWSFVGVDDLPIQTITFGNMPGPAEPVDMFGYQWETFNLSGKPASGSAFFTSCHTMQGKFWMDMAGISTVMRSEEDLLVFEKFAQETLHELEQAISDKQENGG